MDNKDIEQYWPLLEAIRAGKQIESRDSAFNEWEPIDWIEFGMPADHYRVKPEPPTLRPWTPSEAPLGATVRELDESPNVRNIIVGIDLSGADCGLAGYLVFDRLLSDYEHTTDGITWRPCGVEVAP